jgi:hypothetical protein
MVGDDQDGCDYRFAVCTCGHTVFQVSLDSDAGYVSRCCARCENEHEMIDSAETRGSSEADECVCLCDGEEFEVMGIVSDRGRTFHLALRCVACGCLGEYDCWHPRWGRDEYPRWLDRV